MRPWAAIIPQPPHGLDTSNGDAHRILVMNLSGIGNALMATPMLAELRRLYPNARIDLLTTPDSARLLAANPHVNDIIPDPYTGLRRREDYWRVMPRIREAKYGICFLTITAVDFPFSVRPVLARIGTRVIHDYELHPTNRFTRLFTHRVPFDQTRHDVESNLDLLRAVTRAEVSPGRLVLSVPEEETDTARRKLQQAGWQEGRPTVAFCPGSTKRWSDKRWPTEHYVGLARELLANQPDMNLLIFLGPEEADDAIEFRNRLDQKRVMVLQDWPLLTYAAALGLCDAAVSGDSLPVHICAALQVPLIALYGPTDPRRTGPWMCPGKVLTPDCDWIPYYRMPYPPDPKRFEPCMPKLAVSTVLEAVEDALHTSRATSRGLSGV